MELVQELVFTISFSLIVSLLIAKLFSVSSSFDGGISRVLIRVDEKIEKEGKVGNFEDRVKGSEEGGFGCLEGELGSGFVSDGAESGCGDGACYVFDESPERIECKDGVGGLVGSDEGNVVNLTGSLGEEDCVESVEVYTESVSGDGVCYVFDESPKRNECKDCGAGLVGSDEGNVVNFTGSLVQEDRVKFSEVERVSSAIDDGEVKLEEENMDGLIDEDWQGVETTELERQFAAAVAFMDAKVNAGSVNLIDNEVKVELYGLHRVAIEGSCFEPQPMALKVSARANWNSWKRLENLGREDAMEQYIALLSQHVPGWMGSHSSDKQ